MTQTSMQNKCDWDIQYIIILIIINIIFLLLLFIIICFWNSLSNPFEESPSSAFESLEKLQKANWRSKTQYS